MDSLHMTSLQVLDYDGLPYWPDYDSLPYGPLRVTPLQVSDYEISSAEEIDGILVIGSMEGRDSGPSISNDTGLSISNDTGLSISNDTGPSISNDTNHLRGGVSWDFMQAGPSRPTIPDCTLVKDSELAIVSDQICTNNVMQYGIPPPIPGTSSSAAIPGSTSAACTEGFTTSSIYNQGDLQYVIPMTEVQDWIQPGQNIVGQLAGGNDLFPRRRLLVEKALTQSDVGSSIPGILLPKKCVEVNFPPILDKKGFHIVMHDSEETHRTWLMRMTLNFNNQEKVYRLKDTLKYTNYHSLKVGDWLQIFLEEPGSRSILKFHRCGPKYPTNSMENSLMNGIGAWKHIIRKKLTKTDVNTRFQSSGTIFLRKREVESHFADMVDKVGYEVNFSDSEARCIWPMRLKFKSELSGRVYMLQTGDFLKFYALGEKDLIDIWKSESQPISYAVQVHKSS